MTAIVIEYVTTYYLYLFTLFPVMGFIEQMSTSGNRASFRFNKLIQLYYIATFSYIFINHATPVFYDFFGHVTANLFHVILCVLVFIDKEY